MLFPLFSGKTATWSLAHVWRLALLTALLLAPLGRLPVRAQALPAFTSAVMCGEGIYGPGSSGFRIAQTVQDAVGNSYVTGGFADRATFGSFALQGSGYNAFVAKLDPAGTVLWTVQIRSYATGRGIAVDAAGNVLVTGGFSGTTAFGPFVLTSTNSSSYGANVFVAKLNSAGTFLWAVRAGGDESYGTGIAVDAAGNSYVCGAYSSGINVADFGSLRLTPALNPSVTDVFAAKLSPTGVFLWVNGGGSSEDDEANGIAVDATGSAYITCTVRGSYAPSRFGSINLTGQAGGDIVVAKLSPAGNFQWATVAGGRTADYGERIAVDAQGTVHVAGVFMSARPVFGNTTLFHPNQGTYNVFVATLSPAGVWQWVVQGGGPGDDYAYDLAVDAAGNTYVVGSCSYQATFGGTVLTTARDQDVLVCKIDPAGAYVWAMQAGGTGDDKATAAWLAPNGRLLLAGSTFSSLAIFGNQGFAGNPAAETGFLAVLAVGPLAAAAPRNIPALALWPSPARSGEVIQVSGLLARQPVEVRDALGRLVLAVGPAAATGTLAIPLPAGLGSGVYFVRAGQQVFRFTVQ